MRKLLLQLDSSKLPSVFDRVVAYDGGADEVMSYGGITPGEVRDLVYGCIFTRGPQDLKNTAVFIGGADMAAGEALLAAAQQAVFKPFTVSLMLDSNGSNTTAVAAVAKMLLGAGGDVRGQRVLIVAGTGPVGVRAAGLFARAGADEQSRRPHPDRKSTRLNSSHPSSSRATPVLRLFPTRRSSDLPCPSCWTRTGPTRRRSPPSRRCCWERGATCVASGS